MSQLTRVRSGPFHSDDCITLGTSKRASVVNDKSSSSLKPVDLVFEDYPRIDLTEDEYSDLKMVQFYLAEFPQIFAPTACYFRGTYFDLWSASK